MIDKTNGNNDFDVSDAPEYSSNTSKQTHSKAKKNYDSSKVNEFANSFRKRAEYAARTGNIKDLEDLVNEPLFSDEFSDNRNIFLKIKDTTLSYLANLKNNEYLIKSGKYQAIESQIKNLSSKNELISKYRKNYESAKANIIHVLDDYTSNISSTVDELSKKEINLLELKQTFTDDTVELFSSYFSGDIPLSTIKEEGFNTDPTSLQAYREGLAQLQLFNSELDRKNMSLDALNTEYEIMLDKKSGVEFDLIDANLQEFYNNALINQLSVDLKISSRPSLTSLFASLRTLRDDAHSLSNSLIDSENKQRVQYNSASKKAGYDANFRKSYASKQKNRPGFKL